MIEALILQANKQVSEVLQMLLNPMEYVQIIHDILPGNSVVQYDAANIVMHTGHGAIQCLSAPLPRGLVGGNIF